MLALSFPLTWTGIFISSSIVFDSSYSGHFSYAIEESWPKAVVHNSSVMCGATGFNSFTKPSAYFLGRTSAL